MKNYTFRMHPSLTLQNFLCGLRLKAIQKGDLNLCFRQELRESVKTFVQISVSARSWNSEKLQ